MRPGTMIACELQQSAGVAQAMNFIQHDPLPAMSVEECLRVLHIATDRRHIAIKDGDLPKRSGEGGLT
jgi:hypothetical protein